jgi:negative regulator of sigma E activity
MTPHDPTPISDDALRWQLRALRQDTPPSRDLWPDLAARLAATPQQAVAPPRRRMTPFALAASVLLAVTVTWQLQKAPQGDALIQREAAALTRDYTGALAQLDTQVQTAPEIAPALHALDESAAQIRHAIATEPNAHFLLNQLRRTYARRLALTQRAAMT